MIEKIITSFKELAQLTLNSINQAIITTNLRGRIKYFNFIAENLSGWKSYQVEGKLYIFQPRAEATGLPS